MVGNSELVKKRKINGIIRSMVIARQYQMFKNALNLSGKDDEVFPRIKQATYLRQNLKLKKPIPTDANMKSFSANEPDKEFVTEFNIGVRYNMDDYSDDGLTFFAFSPGHAVEDNPIDVFVQRLKSVPISVLKKREYIIRITLVNTKSPSRHACVLVINIGLLRAFVYDPNNLDVDGAVFSDEAIHRSKVFKKTATMFVKLMRRGLAQIEKHRKLSYSSIFGGQMSSRFCLIHTTKFIKTYLSKKESIMMNQNIFWPQSIEREHVFKFKNVSIGESFRGKLKDFKNTNNIKNHWIYSAMCWKYGSRENRDKYSTQMRSKHPGYHILSQKNVGDRWGKTV